MKVLLVLRVKLSPDDLFKAIGLCVNEFGVLRNWKVWVPNVGKSEKMLSSCGSLTSTEFTKDIKEQNIYNNTVKLTQSSRSWSSKS